MAMLAWTNLTFAWAHPRQLLVALIPRIVRIINGRLMTTQRFLHRPMLLAELIMIRIIMLTMIIENVPGIYYFRRVIINSTTCNSISDVVELTVNANPAAVAVSGAGTFCGSATISATGGAGGTIDFQGTNASGTSILLGGSPQTITTSGTYYFRSISAAGCPGPISSPIVVTIIPTPSVSLVATPAELCIGSSSTLTATNSGGSLPVSGNNGTVVADNGVDPQSVSSTIVMGAGALTGLSKITLTMSVTHTWGGDLTAVLTSPCGNYDQYLVTPEAPAILMILSMETIYLRQQEELPSPVPAAAPSRQIHTRRHSVV